jgi:hypothetical protein
MIEKTWKVTPVLKDILGGAVEEALVRGHGHVAAPHVLVAILKKWCEALCIAPDTTVGLCGE